MTVTITHEGKEITFALRADSADYIIRDTPPSRYDRRSDDLLLGLWAAMKTLRDG